MASKKTRKTGGDGEEKKTTRKARKSSDEVTKPEPTPMPGADEPAPDLRVGVAHAPPPPAPPPSSEDALVAAFKPKCSVRQAAQRAKIGLPEALIAVRRLHGQKKIFPRLVMGDPGDHIYESK